MSSATLLLSAGIVLAEALKEQTCYVAIGSGDSAWDAIPLTDAIPQPLPSQTGLLNELARVVATIAYVDENGAISVSPTKNLKFSGSFGVGVGNGTIREVAIIRSDSGTINTGRPISIINIRAISKPSGGGDFSLDRAYKLSLL